MNWDRKFIEQHSPKLEDLFVTRRQFLQRCGMGFGALSLAGLLGEASGAENNTLNLNALAPRTPHFAAKAKRVIHIFAQGAPSQVDTFDPKPLLAKYEGKAIPGVGGVAMPSPFKFKKYGRSGIEVSEVFPNLAAHVD